MRSIKQYVRKRIKSALKAVGFELFRSNPELIRLPRYLCPNAHKLFDFRKEEAFSDIARDVISHGRTTLDYKRLFVLWQAVRNTCRFDQDVAEVGVYKGGSTRFLATSFGHWDRFPTIHIFDTFKGHPDLIVPSLDGPHTEGFFSDTSYKDVKAYLAPFPNVEIHVGTFEESHGSVSEAVFSLVHIDVDIYRSALNCLEFFWPRLCVDGVVVVDDYGFETCKGMKQAVDEFVNNLPSCQAWYMHTGQIVLEKRNYHET